MYDDLGNQNLIVVLFNYNTRNILRLSGLLLSHQHFYPTLLSALNIFCDGVVLLLLTLTCPKSLFVGFSNHPSSANGLFVGFA